MNDVVAQCLSEASLIFWDFDGVIKESVDVKTLAYENLFRPYGNKIASRVRHHHEVNGGISRFDKIPLYLEWAGESSIPEKIELFCELFSQNVVQAVIDSPWVPGVRRYLLNHCTDQHFILVSATPEDEIKQILQSLKLSHCFQEIFGAPNMKGHVIETALERLSCLPHDALMVGDSESDLSAAQANAVPFLLRRTSLNARLQASYQGPMFDDLNDE
jgi:phosphoglycolate phosphatase-like HAD superfamily hydrolase